MKIRDVTMVSPLTVSSMSVKIASISFITVNPTPGTAPEAQEVYNNVLWN